MKQMRTAAAGFSLLEMMIVVAITLAVAAMAVPKMITVVADVKMRSAVNSASGLMQQARMVAVKNNLYERVRYTVSGGGGLMYVDLNNDASVQSTEPQAELGRTVLVTGTPGVTTLDSTQLSFTPSSTTNLMFNPRGLPCSAVNTCGAGFVFYFTDTRSLGSPGWGAVSVSPAGRVKTWIWDGAAWSN